MAAMTLLEVEQQLLGGAERRAQRLVLLQVLAVMVESLQHTELLRRTSQVRNLELWNQHDAEHKVLYQCSA